MLGAADNMVVLLQAVTLLYPERSLFFFRKTNPLRKACVYISHNRFFDWFILACILCNCVTLALSSGRQDFDKTRLGAALQVTEYLWVGIFTAEALFKIMAMGFLLAPGTYLRDGECRTPRRLAIPPARCPWLQPPAATAPDCLT